MFSPFFRFNESFRADIILEQLEERIVLDGVVDGVSHPAELLSARTMDSDSDRHPVWFRLGTKFDIECHTISIKPTEGVNAAHILS